MSSACHLHAVARLSHIGHIQSCGHVLALEEDVRFQPEKGTYESRYVRSRVVAGDEKLLRSRSRATAETTCSNKCSSAAAKSYCCDRAYA